MAITIGTDKYAIRAVLSTDEYLTDYLGFNTKEIYMVRATDTLLGAKNSKQIFIYNATPEPTINPVVTGIVYEVDVSVPYRQSGDADNAIEQIIALLSETEIGNTHRVELLDPPVILSSDTALYQVGVRFVVYSTIYTKAKKNPKSL